MLMVSMGMDAQIRVGYQTDSAKIAEYRERIGIDMTVPDFETKSKQPILTYSWTSQACRARAA